MSAVIEAIACGKHYPLPLVYLLSVTILVYGFFNNWSYDDPDISYRYADNLINARGFSTTHPNGS